MIRKIIIAVTVTLLIASSAVYAKNISMGLKAGTLGAGLEAEAAFSDSFGARVGVNYFDYSYSGTESDIEYDFDLTLQSVSALLDWHPLHGSFRVSAGVLLNGNELDMDGKSTTTFEIGNATYSVSDVGNLEGRMDFDAVAPYAGIGWDTSFGKSSRFGFLLDLGVVYQGSPDIDLSADGPIAGNQAFIADLEREEETLQEDIDVFKYYPVIAIGFNYRY